MKDDPPGEKTPLWEYEYDESPEYEFICAEEKREYDAVPWHQAFFNAMRIELEDYEDKLEFTSELELSKEPLRVDLLIIRKDPDLHIEKPIGRIFRQHNLIEFKSPLDYVSIDDYHKALSYAGLYKFITRSANSVEIEDITITFVCSNPPVKLFKYLTERGKIIEPQWPGIYYVQSEYQPVQFIITREINLKDNLFLKGITRNMESQLLLDILEQIAKHPKNVKYEEYQTIILDANLETFEEVIKNMSTFATMSPEKRRELEELIEAKGLNSTIKEQARLEIQKARQEAQRQIEEALRQKEEEAKKIIGKMLEEKVDIALIARVSGWTVEDIEALGDR